MSILRGTAGQEHSVECRRRLEKEHGVTERAKRAKKKMGEYVGKKMTEDEEVRRKSREVTKMKEETMDDSIAQSANEADKKRKGDEGMTTAMKKGRKH